MAFRDAAKEPTSVFSGKLGMRWERSPAAIFAAVFSMRLSGTRVDWINRTEMMPPKRTTTAEMTMQKAVRSCTASSWSLMDRPMKSTPLISEPSS